MIGLYVIGSAVLLAVCFKILDRMHRASEERDLSFPCSCGEKLEFERFAGRSAIRRCTECKKTDIRPAMHVCPNPACNGTLLGGCPQGAPDGTHFYDNRCCPKCGIKVVYTRPHSAHTRRALERYHAMSVP